VHVQRVEAASGTAAHDVSAEQLGLPNLVGATGGHDELAVEVLDPDHHVIDVASVGREAGLLAVQCCSDWRDGPPGAVDIGSTGK
jgi:hypothetical protein